MGELTRRVAGKGRRAWGRLPTWGRGVLVAWCAWGMAGAFGYALEEWEARLPRWVCEADLPDTVGSVCKFLSMPVAIGWWLVHGDGRGPSWWMENVALNLAFAGMVSGYLGAALGEAASRWRGGESEI